MIKKLLRKLAYSIYKIGQFEASKIEVASKKEEYNRNAIVGQGVVLEACEIYNNQKNRDRISIGNKSVIKGELMIFRHGGEIIIGNHCFVGPGCRIWSAKKIVIGDRVLISHYGRPK